MTHQFLILSYTKDLPWLLYCLRSVKEFAHGFLPPVIYVPCVDHALAEVIVGSVGLNAQVKSANEPEGKGQLFSQVTKCYADQFCRGDIIHFFDSDCILTDHFVPGMVMHGGKPVMLYNSYEHLRATGAGAAVWQDVVEKNLGFRPEFEYLRRFPLSYHRDVFPALRERLAITHNKETADYIYSTGKNKWPQDFCESNVIGAYAHLHHPEWFHWINIDNQSEPELPVIQFWSHGGFERPCDSTFSFSKKENDGRRPWEVIKDVLGGF